ncbi:hypothetical protein D3C87_951830 [compost metagenome]
MPQLSFFITNLLIPGDPQRTAISTPSGGRTLERVADYERAKKIITAARGPRASELPIENTYIVEHVSFGQQSAAAVDEKTCDELTPILLAASFATGMSVTVRDGALAGTSLMGNPPPKWPRPRAMDGPSWVVSAPYEFQALVNAFVKSWPRVGLEEKVLLLVHHWLDALACWSMEDLYLSATTLLQVIAATEEKKMFAERMRAGKGKRHVGWGRPEETKVYFYAALKKASNRMIIRKPSFEAKEMRDSLVHEGSLRGEWMKKVERKRLAGIGENADDGGDRLTDQDICAGIVADVMNWFDEYVHAALRREGCEDALRFT